MRREAEEVGQGQEGEGLECLSRVFGLESKGRRFKQGCDGMELNRLGHKWANYERWKVTGGRREHRGLLDVYHSGQLGTRAELGLWQWRCKMGPLWKCMSEVNGQDLVDSEGTGQYWFLSQEANMGSALSQEENTGGIAGFYGKENQICWSHTKSLQGPCKFSGQEMLSRN